MNIKIVDGKTIINLEEGEKIVLTSDEFEKNGLEVTRCNDELKVVNNLSSLKIDDPNNEVTNANNVEEWISIYQKIVDILMELIKLDNYKNETIYLKYASGSYDSVKMYIGNSNKTVIHDGFELLVVNNYEFKDLYKYIFASTLTYLFSKVDCKYNDIDYGLDYIYFNNPNIKVSYLCSKAYSDIIMKILNCYRISVPNEQIARDLKVEGYLGTQVEKAKTAYENLKLLKDAQIGQGRTREKRNL